VQGYISYGRNKVVPKDTEEERLKEISAEMHAKKLVKALQNAILGAPHWRTEALALLNAINTGTLPQKEPKI
jgi:hypothetical protein